MIHPTDMMQDIERILITEEEIQAAIRKVGAQLAAEYREKNPLFVGILKGVVPFFAQMIQAVPIPCQIDFMSVSSYQGVQTTGKVTFRKDLDHSIEGRHVVILEDILDSGYTLRHILALLRKRNPASLKICTLLDKPAGRKVELEPDYTCFTVPGEFVVGFGLDYEDYYRNLPFIGVLKPEVYSD